MIVQKTSFWPIVLWCDFSPLISTCCFNQCWNIRRVPLEKENNPSSPRDCSLFTLRSHVFMSLSVLQSVWQKLKQKLCVTVNIRMLFIAALSGFRVNTQISHTHTLWSMSTVLSVFVSNMKCVYGVNCSENSEADRKSSRSEGLKDVCSSWQPSGEDHCDGADCSSTELWHISLKHTPTAHVWETRRDTVFTSGSVRDVTTPVTTPRCRYRRNARLYLLTLLRSSVVLLLSHTLPSCLTEVCALWLLF